jgi:methionyl aminopeptidase
MKKILIKPGVNTLEIDAFIKKEIENQKGIPSFLNYDTRAGIYPYSSCIALNYQLVHTTPKKDVIIQNGDLVTIDLAVNYKGIHADTAYTIEVGTNNEEHFLNVGKRALKNALKAAKAGNKIGDISYEMQKEVEKFGFNVSYDLVGHGIGHKMWEPPQIPCFGQKGTGLKLEKSQALAIEIMYMKGSPRLKLGEDGFSMDTADKSLSAQFEHTIIVTDSNPIIIT